MWTFANSHRQLIDCIIIIKYICGFVCFYVSFSFLSNVNHDQYPISAHCSLSLRIGAKYKWWLLLCCWVPRLIKWSQFINACSNSILFENDTASMIHTTLVYCVFPWKYIISFFSQQKMTYHSCHFVTYAINYVYEMPAMTSSEQSQN